MPMQLTPQLVLQAYRGGAFPMGDEFGRVRWYSPDPRCVFPLEAFHVPRSLRQVLRRGVFEVRMNTAFGAVIDACCDRAEGTWINGPIRAVYVRLHEMGHGHSVEAWQDGVLAGGLYGVAIGGAFFGESMFHRRTNASKVALAGLVARMRERGFTLLDTQWSTPHLEMFGATNLPRDEYLRQLAAALERDCVFAERR